MMDAAPPPQLTACVAHAAGTYGLDPDALWAFVRSRKGASAQYVQAENGTMELGLARIPADVARRAERQGFTLQQVMSDDCLNVGLAGLMMAQAGISASHGSSDSDCLAGAAQRYQLPLPIFKAVVGEEGGWLGLKKPNKNGSYDYGPAQINSIHLEELSKYGVSESQLMWDRCVNLHVSAYRLRFEINRAGDLWRGVGNYHSRTPSLSSSYAERVRRRMAGANGGQR
ncbi:MULTISPECIES: lytic transglycosylase domain-containing protein [Xanthomonas]|uniref:lytic transglycosylase domain-containing protein n=2 Tax=Xanthomonas TaxID=338 RepID=UPI000D3CF10F|nr:lytic transglycosylase domain-containing protein [Xanthomonas campestris]MCF8869917.1 lytic transglycosylase domain-containing protein [Xanthomonas campestris pv. campestris]MDM7718713.1 lytic transglycosylase domain-containing protein [Xanthomonas campestris pv. campestris]MEA0953191.1 lytic transglycosylase domain-containing protein [Xanthomonas campestris pv. campestris]MEB1105592.1 lytic transglycosylase domain-containing protein [Xanthomonas campestris pv. campestris]MEB1704810.1 lytic